MSTKFSIFLSLFESSLQSGDYVITASDRYFRRAHLERHALFLSDFGTSEPFGDNTFS